MELAEVKQFIETNKTNPEVTSLISSFVNTDSVKNFLTANEDGAKLFNSLADSKVTKGIDTWKQNNLDKLINEAIEKANPKETAEQKQFRELKSQFEKVQNEAKKEKLLNKALSTATEKGLPIEVIEHFLGEDEDATIKNLEKLENSFKSALQKHVEQTFKSIGREPNMTNQPGQISYKDLESMSVKDLKKFNDTIAKIKF